MNLLLDDAPDHITVCGQVIPIKTDFRTWIRFENTMLKDCDNEERFKAILDVMNGIYYGFINVELFSQGKELAERNGSMILRMTST